MLQTIRDKSKGPILTFIIVSVCLMFAVTGVDSILGSGSADRVAKVNGEKVTAQELNEAIFLQKRQLISRMGDQLDPAMLDEKNLKQPALDTLIQRKLLLQMADEHKMLVSDAEISKMIAENPDFQSDGKFSNETFKNLIAGAGLTPALYKRLFSTDVLLEQISSGVVDTGFITDKDIAIDTRFTHQSRDIRYITLSIDKEKASIVLSDDEVKQFYEKNPDRFQSDESAIVEYIELNQADFKANISEQEIKDVYAQEVAAFISDEQREVSHILIEVNNKTAEEKDKSRALLEDIKTKVSAGEDFAELARTYSEDLGSKDSGGVLGLLDEAAFPKEFVTAAKILKQGEISGIVETESGLHLIQLNNITKPVMPAFEDRKEAITSDLQLSKVTPMYLEALEQLKDLAFNSADLTEPAQTLKIDIKLSAPVTRKGGAGIFSNKAVYSAVYKESVLKNGENSDVIELSPSQSVVVRVKEHSPSALIPFEQIAAKVKTEAVMAKAQEQLAEKADNIKSKLISGADVEQLANENGYAWQVALAAKRTTPDADKELINAAFGLPQTADMKLAVDKIKKTNGDFIVLAVSNVKDGSLSDLSPMESQTIKSYISRANGVEEFSAIEAALKARSDIKIYE